MALFLLMGAGCQRPEWLVMPFGAAEVAVADLRPAAGSTLTLQKLEISPLSKFNKQHDRVVAFTEFVPNERVAFSWSETFEQETPASLTAREAAERASGVGEESVVPAAVYETIALTGSVTSSGLASGGRLYLPSEWPEGEVANVGEENSVLWLSKTRYDELAATRHTNLALSSFDANLAGLAKAADAFKDLLSKLQSGSPVEVSAEEVDITEIEADAAWGKYTLQVNGKKVRVTTIQAENKLATFTILADPENPLILKVELKAWAYGTEALGFVTDEFEITGYQVTNYTR